MPFFSIILPTYNRPEQLKRALKSVLNQTFEDYEVLVINNGDVRIDQDLSDKRIRYYDEEKKGANYARNKGISLSTSSFICFLDDDDEYFPNHLEALHQLIEKNEFKVALYKTFARIEDKDGKYRDQNDPLKQTSMHNLHYIFLYPLYMNCVCIHKEILKKEIFEPTVKVAQDYDLWIRILVDHAFFISPIVTTIYHYSIHSTSRASKNKYYNYINLYSGYFKDPLYGKNIPTSVKRDRIFKYYFWLMCEFKNELSFTEYISAIGKLIYYHPTIIIEKRLYAIFLKGTQQSANSVVAA